MSNIIKSYINQFTCTQKNKTHRETYRNTKIYTLSMLEQISVGEEIRNGTREMEYVK